MTVTLDIQKETEKACNGYFVQEDKISEQPLWVPRSILVINKKGQYELPAWFVRTKDASGELVWIKKTRSDYWKRQEIQRLPEEVINNDVSFLDLDFQRY